MIMPIWFVLLLVAPAASGHSQNVLASNRAKASTAEARFVGESVTGDTSSQNLRPEEGGPYGHEVSEQTFVKSENGKTFSETIRCRDGKCKTSKSKGSAADSQDLVGFPKMHSLFHDVGGGFDRSMRALENNIGSLGDDFRIRTSAPNSMLKDLKDAPDSLSSAESGTSSVTSETQVKDGKVIKTTKVCKNGHCEVHVTKGDVGASKDSADLEGQGDSAIPQGIVFVQPSIIAEVFGDSDTMTEPAKEDSDVPVY